MISVYNYKLDEDILIDIIDSLNYEWSIETLIKVIIIFEAEAETKVEVEVEIEVKVKIEIES